MGRDLTGMLDSGDDPGEPDEEVETIPDEEQKWHGYSDYENVAIDLRKETNKAIEAYAHIKGRASQNVGITPQTAVEAKAAMLRITKRLFYEVKKNAQIDEFKEIYERWAGVTVEEDPESDGYRVIDDGDDPGYVKELEDANFRAGLPEWADTLVDDIITAGWELGYIRAGVEKPADPDDEEQQVREMFE